MMRVLTLLGAFLAIARRVSAVFADEAYQVDYHHELLGRPLSHATFFHKPYRGSKASLTYTLSNKLIVGAVNPGNGSVVWRQPISPQMADVDNGFLCAGEDEDTVVSGAGSDVVAWVASDGRFAWRQTFRDFVVQDLELLETSASSDTQARDAIVLLKGAHAIVKRLDADTGKVLWAFEDTSGDAPFQISSSLSKSYYISLHSTLLGAHKIRVTSLDAKTGQKGDTYTLSSESDVSNANDVLFAGASPTLPLLIWADKLVQNLKINVIGDKQIISLKIDHAGDETIESVKVHASKRTGALNYFLVKYQTRTKHWAEIFSVDLMKNQVRKVRSLPPLTGSGAFSASISDDAVLFTRISNEGMTLYHPTQDDQLQSWPVKSSVMFGTSNAHIEPQHVASEVVLRSQSSKSYAVRSTVLFSSGDWALLQNGKITWQRNEGLAGALDAVCTEQDEVADLTDQLNIEHHQSGIGAFVHRARRHVAELQNFHPWLREQLTKALKSLTRSDDGLSSLVAQDGFGLNKIVVVATEDGHLYGLAAGHAGVVVWNRKLVELSDGQKWSQPKLTNQGKGVVRVSSLKPETNLLINTTSGNTLPAQALRSDEAQGSGAKTASHLFKIDGNVVSGSADGKSGATASWRFVPRHNDRLYKVTPNVDGGLVASIGKVLGDRRVLYKYLNPNIALITTVGDSSPRLTAYLVDTISGHVLHSSVHADVDVSRPMAAIVCENWFTYSFTKASSDPLSRGHQIVFGELYESANPDDRGPLGASANYSSLRPAATHPYVISQNYHIPDEISHLAVTRTRQGITTRQLLATLPAANSIVGIPLAALDPRRPVGRDPTSLELAEGLTKYSPVLDFDPRWYLNHRREILGVKDVIVAPALIESTSIVFAYGLDVFGTRVTPSFAFDVLGKGFNKVQMLLTVGALFVCTLLVAPLVRRKQINARWQM